ncbi:MAG: hypothetical protein A3B70_04070 [Deltaproteobacteria bacterium RIFCSPHIGHO2_02_FULL_40_11]|nr:MAG: hypothetical protein A3B70_04070 [Deltaproteobacteria bacterium RIFCSPHIGHO2_02_FULL_40_11]
MGKKNKKSSFQFEYPLRVRNHETDRLGQVLGASFLNYFDIVLTEFLRNLRFSYPNHWAQDLYTSIKSMECNFKRSAFYDDELMISLKIHDIQKEQFQACFEICQKAGRQSVASGVCCVSLVDPKKCQSIEIPQYFIDALSQYERHTASL